MEQRAQALVCSAACGADLLALEAAAGLGMRRCIVLPYTRARFRDTSVVDRPGNWGERFDAMVDTAAASGDPVVLGYAEGDETAYLATNTAILEQAALLAEQLHQTVGAIVVWDGAARGEDDVTAAFLREAQHRGFPVWHVATLWSITELTSYSIRKDIQEKLAAIRTDLDSFSDLEAYALIVSGYRMTEHEFRCCISGFPEPPADRPQWPFLVIEEEMRRERGIESKYIRLSAVLETASRAAFKIWTIPLVFYHVEWVALCA
jgi:hypothetical protein